MSDLVIVLNKEIEILQAKLKDEIRVRKDLENELAAYPTSKDFAEMKAALAEKELELKAAKVWADLAEGWMASYKKQIAALQARIKAMEEEWSASMCIPCEVSVCDVKNKNYRYQKDIAALQAECDGYKNGQMQLQYICDGLQDSIKKYADERKALTARIKELEEDIRELMKYATEEGV